MDRQDSKDHALSRRSILRRIPSRNCFLNLRKSFLSCYHLRIPGALNRYARMLVFRNRSVGEDAVHNHRIETLLIISSRFCSFPFETDSSILLYLVIFLAVAHAVNSRSREVDELGFLTATALDSIFVKCISRSTVRRPNGTPIRSLDGSAPSR
jgi:hypothetical protein